MVNSVSLRACFGVRANNSSSSGNANQSSNGFAKTVGRLFKSLFQCKSASANLVSTASSTELMERNKPANTDALPDLAQQPATCELQSELWNYVFKSQLAPDLKARLAVSVSMTNAWGDDPEPLIQLSRAQNPESLPEPESLLKSLGLNSGKNNPEALETLCGLIQKKVYPMMHAAMDHPASAAKLGLWLCKVLGKGEQLPRLGQLKLLDPLMLEAFDDLLVTSLCDPQVNDTHQQALVLVQQAMVLKTLLSNEGLDFTFLDPLKADPNIGKDFAMEVATHDHRRFVFLPPAMRADKQVALTAVNQKGRLFSHVGQALKSDRDVALAAVRTHGVTLYELANELRADKEIVTAAVKNYGPALAYANDELKADREVVLHAVSEWGDSLGFASEQLRDDAEVVTQACKENTFSFRFASQRLKNDRAFILNLVSHVGAVLLDANRAFRNDEEVVKAAVSSNGSALAAASNRLRNNKEVVKIAVSNDTTGKTLHCASSRLRNNAEVVAAAIKKNEAQLKDAGFLLRNNKKFIKKALFPEKSVKSLANLSVFCKDKEMVLGTVSRDGAQLEKAPKRFTRDRKVVSAAVAQNGHTIKWASKNLRNDMQIARAAVAQQPESIEFVGEKLKNDKELINLALSSSGRSLGKLDPTQRADKELVRTAVSQDGTALAFASQSLRGDKDIVKAAYLQNPNSIRFASDDLRHDRGFVKDIYMESKKYKRSVSG